METKECDKKKLILIVDDEEQIVLLLKTILNVYGFDSISSLSPKGIVDFAAKENPDLIILDIAMPEIDGYQICRSVKSDERTQHIPIVMITALALAQDRKLALDSGADGFILKPFDPRDVIAEIERLTPQA